MPIKDQNQVKVTVSILSGPITPAQKQAWTRFWQKLLAQARMGAVK
jgi:hypothetical protein